MKLTRSFLLLDFFAEVLWSQNLKPLVAKDAQICLIWAHILEKFSFAVWGRMLVKMNGEFGKFSLSEISLVKLTRGGDETTSKWNCHLFSSLLFYSQFNYGNCSLPTIVQCQALIYWQTLKKEVGGDESVNSNR